MRRGAVAWLAVTLAGCVHSRQVTPWLRSTYDEPWVVIAEPGGPRPVASTEHLVAGRWTQVSQSSCALGFDHGKHAVHELDTGGLGLVTETGPVVPLECTGSLRATPDGGGLVCLEMDGWVGDPAQSLVVVLKHFASDGTLAAEPQTMVLPGGSEPRNYFTHFIGFLDSRPMLSVHDNNERDDLWPGVSKRCALYEAAFDHWELKATVKTSSWAECGRAEFWSRRAPLALVAGSAPVIPGSDEPCH